MQWHGSTNKSLDMAKRAGRVGFRLSQLGLRVGSWVIGQSGCETGWVGLTRIFQTFFFQLQKQINDNLFRENK